MAKRLKRGDLEKTTRRFKRRAQRQDAAVLAVVLREWNRLLAKLLVKAGKLKEAGASEAAVSRAETLAKEAGEQVEALNEKLSPVIEKGREAAIETGIEQAETVLAEAGVPASSMVHVNKDAFETAIGMTQDGSPLSKVLDKGAGYSAKEAIMNLIKDGIAEGRNPEDIARDMVRLGYTSRKHALLVARTEVMRAYRISTIETYRQNGTKKAIWCASESSATCAACWSFDGRAFDLDKLPNDHPNGRCTIIPVIDDEDEETWDSEERFKERLTEEEQKKILGPKRWKLWKEGKLKWEDIAAVKPNETYGPTLGISPLKDGTAPELSEDVSGNGDVKFLNGSESGKRYEALKGDVGEQNATRGPQKTNSEDSPVGDLKPQILTKEQAKLLVSLKIFAQLTKAEQKAIIGDANYELYKKGYDPKGFYYKKPNGDSLDDGFEYVASPVYLPPSLMEAFETPEFKKYQNMIPRIVELLNNMPDQYKEAWNDALKDFKGLVSGARNRYLIKAAKIQMKTNLTDEEFVCSLFHEFGHALDYGLGSATNPATSRRPNMAAQIKRDVTNMAKALSGKDDYDEAFGDVCGFGFSEGLFQQMFSDHALPTGETRGLQDIISGSTNGKYVISFGHSPDEWIDPQSLPRETLAQFFRIMVYFNGRLSPEFENLLKTYFKSIWDECDDIIRSKGKARSK